MTQIVTAIFGSYDEVKPPLEQSVPCQFTLLTDNPMLEAPGWRRPVDYKSQAHPRLSAKKPKLQPWRYCIGDGPWIWIDGSFEIISPTFVEEVLAGADGHLLAQWEHPDRSCVYAEAVVSSVLPKYADVPVVEQAAHYREIGHPTLWGLWATGLIVYREPVDYLSGLWWAEMNRWGYQDQISQPVALRAAGMRPKGLPYGLRSNPWLKHHPHVDGTL
jgi:hypothetical protein